MKTESCASQRQPELDRRLNELVDEMTRLLESGEAFDLDAFVAEHPGHATELRRLFPAIEGLVGF